MINNQETIEKVYTEAMKSLSSPSFSAGMTIRYMYRYIRINISYLMVKKARK